MRDPETVAGIVSALRHVHGDGVARLLLNDGLSLAALIEPCCARSLGTPTRSN
jgi:hypothetical protein